MLTALSCHGVLECPACTPAHLMHRRLHTCMLVQPHALDLSMTGASTHGHSHTYIQVVTWAPHSNQTAGGSNFGGLAFPILREKLAGRMSPKVLAVEPAACPSLTKGRYVYDYGDTAGGHKRRNSGKAHKTGWLPDSQGSKTRIGWY